MDTTRSHSNPSYTVWVGMKDRCNNPNSVSFKNYGAKGVKVCQQWAESFETFLMQAGERPSKLHQLDRIDPKKGYEPGNVRWVTSKDQQRNRSNNNLVEFNGEVRPVAEWAEILGISRNTLASRLWRGWSVERAMKKAA